MRSAAEIASDLKPLHDFLRLQPVTAEHDGVLVKELLYSIGHPSLAQWLFEEDNNVNTKSTGRFKVNRNASAEIIQAWAMAELKAKRTHPSPYLMRHISSHVVGLPKDLFGLYPSSFTMSTDTGAIYISYTGRDPEGDAWAERVAEWCREWNYGYFRDKDHSNGIRAGEEWRSALYRFLGQAQAIVCLCSQQFESSPWCVGEVAIALSEGKTVIPILLAETEEQLQTQTMPMQLQDHQAIMVTGAAHPTPKQLAEVKLRLRATLQSKFKWRELLAWDAALPPYPGLPSFEERHAPVFFGRDAEIEGVLERLSSMAVRSSGFLLLLGASGCGKSSLVRAGVVPRLRGDCTRPWLVLSPFRPGLDPLIELRRAFTEAWALLKETSPPAERGESDEVALLRELQWLQVVSGGPVLLIIDQFEELLLEEQQPQADQFLRFIQTLLQTGPKSVLVLATLRIEFLVQMQSRWPKLAAFATTVTIEPIAQADFSELITGPASRSGLTLQPGLADRLVAESGGRDALALLAFTLEMLWRARMRRGGALKGLRGDRWDLTVDDYEAFGGVQGLVSNLAQNCWNSAVGSEADAAALRQAFLDHLVTLNEEGQAVKSVAQLQELPELSRPIVERMVNWRLLVSDAGRVEIAHEGLLRSWQPLVGWIEEGREEMLQRRRVRRLGEDLKVEAPQQRRQVLELLAALAAAGGSEGLAVQKEATVPLTQLLAAEGRPVAEREDAALVLALIGAEEPLRQCLADTTAPVALRRRAAESLGLLARRSSDLDQRQRLVMELESWLRSEALDVLIEIEFDPAKLEPAEIQVLVEETQRQVAEGMQQALQSGQLPSGIDESELQQISQMAFEDQHKQRLQQLEQQVWAEGKSSGWAEHDALLPLLQGASRGLQLAASADLPLFGSGPGLVVPMLTLTALEEGNALRIRTEVVVVPVWQLPLPAGEQLELVLVPAGEYTIGSPQAEAGRDVYSQIRQKCAGVDVEALQPVRLKQFALLRMPISQGQWRAVVEAVAVGERELEAAPGKATPESLWERHGQPGELAVDSVSWNDTQEWLRRLNRWLNEQWRELGGSGETPRLALPSENQWEAACRADAKPPTPFHFGATLDASWARYDASHTYGRGRKGPKGELAWPNGASGLVNYWGLGELHGQLLEWCGDLWNRDPWAAVQRSLDLFGTKHDAEAAPMADGPVDQSDTALRGTMESLYRLLRGGSWFDAPHGARAAFRSSNYPDYVISLVGLRPCCPSPPSALLGP
jgi:formylglycine-generating enzyme required for sulfatase activity